MIMESGMLPKLAENYLCIDRAHFRTSSASRGFVANKIGDHPVLLTLNVVSSERRSPQLRSMASVPSAPGCPKRGESQ